MLKMQSPAIKHDRKKCIVPGCNSTRQVKNHVFPKDEVQGRLWVEAVSSPVFNGLTYKQIYDLKYRVCHLHFLKDDYVCGPRNLFKQKPIPSLLLPIKNVSDVPAEEIGKEASIDLDHKRQKQDPSTPTRATISNIDFSPITYRNCLSDSPKSVNSIRQSSCHILKDVTDLQCSTPKSHRKRKYNVHKLQFIDENIVEEETSTETVVEEQRSTETLIEEEISTETLVEEQKSTETLIEEEISTETLVEEQKSTETLIEEEKSTKALLENEKSLKKRASKRMIWKHIELDAKTREMYEEVLRARKEVDKCQTKNKRYCFIHDFNFETKYTRAKLRYYNTE